MQNLKPSIFNFMKDRVLNNVVQEPVILFLFSEFADQQIFKNKLIREVELTIFNAIGLSVEQSVNDHINEYTMYEN